MKSKIGIKLLSKKDFDDFQLWKFDEDSDLYCPVLTLEEFPDRMFDLLIRANFESDSGLKYNGYIVGFGKIYSIGIFLKNKIYLFNKNLIEYFFENFKELEKNLKINEPLRISSMFPLKFTTTIEQKEFKNLKGVFDPFENKFNFNTLSSTVSYILRHAPEKYGLALDDNGWVNVDDLLTVLKADKIVSSGASEKVLHDMMSFSLKQRYEIKGGKIRALYDHSALDKIVYECAEPPELLFYGTLPENVKIIMDEGLVSKKGQYVHLSTDVQTAQEVGSLKSENPSIIIINTILAYFDGVKFYKENEDTWLADYIPAKYICVI